MPSVPQQDRVGVAGRHVALSARAERAVLPADPAGEVDREPKGVLRDRLGVRGAAAQHVDAVAEARLVVDVGEEVALDVHHRAEAPRAGQALGRQIRLADDRERRGRAASRAASSVASSRSTTS